MCVSFPDDVLFKEVYQELNVMYYVIEIPASVDACQLRDTKWECRIKIKGGLEEILGQKFYIGARSSHLSNRANRGEMVGRCFINLELSSGATNCNIRVTTSNTFKTRESLECLLEVRAMTHFFVKREKQLRNRYAKYPSSIEGSI